MAKASVSLDDKYQLSEDRIYLTGTQALVRLALMQARRDRAQGLNIAGFVSGYRGSPLGGVDLAFERAAAFIEAADIRFVPGINEDLAATAILGTQQINLFGPASKQGVFGMWYGKGPGVDRSGDALRHGNLAGSSPNGGVLLLAGDDHVCKSSTTSHQSEYALMDAMIPILAAANIADILDHGLYGWSLSRYSGCWTSLKLTSDIVDTSRAIDVTDHRLRIVTPDDFALPADGLGIRLSDTPQAQERRLHNLKLPAALAFARANRLDRVMLGRSRGRLGLITTGKAYADTREALARMGLTEERASALGLSVYKVAMVWPLEPEGLMRFSAGFDELLVIEEKRPLVEAQVKDILYNLPADRRPRILGKAGIDGAPILPAHDDLNPDMIARAIWARLREFSDNGALFEQLSAPDDERPSDPPPPLALRTPYFCSGCPHSTSTRVPEGSRAMAGIGCHWMAQSMDRDTATCTHMGAEGANWIGQSPYVANRHIFQNMGDGTFFHSGLLAIRAAVAAKVNITYKILFNDAVAMTGGQSHDGSLSAQRITHMARAEGVECIAVVADDPEKYDGQPDFAAGVSVRPREALDAVQRELRDSPGVSVLVYDQVCAATKRRRRKRARSPRPETYALINEAVCEGCGDCSAKSNCLSIVPVETEFGRKRRIDLPSCNADLSCLGGFCPSFVTVAGVEPARARSVNLEDLGRLALPDPQSAAPVDAYNILIAGVGGTGVVTLGAILAMAAHLDGLECATLDMTGLAQKGGPVTTHLRLARGGKELHSARITPGSADLILGCDSVTTVDPESLKTVRTGRTRIIVNRSEAVTAQFINDRDFRLPFDRIIARLRDTAGAESIEVVDAVAVTAQLLRDTLAANLFLMGYAYQRGWIPVSAAAIDEAVRLNAASVAMNQAGFALGRLAAHDSAALAALIDAQTPARAESHRLSASLDEVVSRRRRVLADYQSDRYAQDYATFVNEVRRVERDVVGAEGSLSEAVARGLFKLMAYKDEYEVARLYLDRAFQDQLRNSFERGGRIKVHLAPPWLAKIDRATGEPRKMAFGRWVFMLFRLLAKLRFLRGTPLDPFGWTAERRAERQLIDDYRRSITMVLGQLTADRVEAALRVARVVEPLRGFGPVKLRSLEEVRRLWKVLEADYRASCTTAAATPSEKKCA